MFKDKSIRIKMAVIYILIAVFSIPLAVFSHALISHANERLPHEDDNLVFLMVFVYLAYGIVYFLSVFIAGRRLVKVIVKPLRDLEKASRQIAEGDVSVDLNYHSKDEIGSLTNAFLDMTTAIREQSSVLTRIADGDYTTNIPIRSDHDIMNTSINRMIDNNNEMLIQVRHSIAQVSVGAKQIADGASSLAQGSTEQSAAVEELSNFVEKIVRMTEDNARMTERASVLADEIMRNAEKGSLQMDEMGEAVRDINQSSKNISKVMKAIDDIAFQTNILALNAAVEAARAGVHGKGFAVVADEVRNLAVKSAEAARETSEMISDSIKKAELGNQLADETAVSLKGIVSGINESSHIFGEIAKCSEDQSHGISQINSGLTQVAMVVSQNSATAEESAAASEEMSGQASMLEELISQFELKEEIHF